MDRRVVIGQSLDVSGIVYKEGLGRISLASEDSNGRAALSNVSLKLSNMNGEMTTYVNMGAVRTACKIFVPYGQVFHGVLSTEGFKLDRDNEIVTADFVDYIVDVLARAKGLNISALSTTPRRALINAVTGFSTAPMERWFTDVKDIIRQIINRFDPASNGVQFQFGQVSKQYYVGGARYSAQLAPLPEMTCFDFLNEISSVFNLVWGRGLDGAWFFVDKLSWLRQRRNGQIINLPRFRDSVIISTRQTGSNRVTFSYTNATDAFDGVTHGEYGDPIGTYTRAKEIKSAFSCPYDATHSATAVIPSTQNGIVDGTHLISSTDLLNASANKYVGAGSVLGEFYDIELRTLGEVQMKCSLMDADSVYVAASVFPYAPVAKPNDLIGFLHARNVDVDLRNDTMEITAIRYGI